ncbi:TPT-domain-containing protein [Pluteus cervinus]|uniref:TPT-domain-containing protein n=1 Tax=Pluteus cervinus TaxID=181527 RepID=A0ACD3BD74_9AGAR|nr:TPT-domain-containing protein [Pluteus cervinus]
MSRFKAKPGFIRSRARPYLPALHQRPQHKENITPTLITLSLSSFLPSSPSSKSSESLLLPGFCPPSPSKHRRLSSRLVDSPALWLCLYFFCNLGLTLFNKGVLVHFPFPYTLSAVHALSGSLGTAFLERSGAFKAVTLDWRQRNTLIAFSALYSVNILLSNVSLRMVTVPFHQVVRSSTPLFIILLSLLFLGRRSSTARLVSLVPVIMGVGLATYGDYQFTMPGLVLTLLGTLLAAAKTLATEILQVPPRNYDHSHPETDDSILLAKSDAYTPSIHHKFRFSNLFSLLPPISSIGLLHLLSPIAFFQTIVLAYLTGELGRVATHFSLGEISLGSSHGSVFSVVTPSHGLQVLFVLMNGLMAFGLNVTSFGANRRVGAVAMSVAGNVKQVLTILCAVLIFEVTITGMNATGIALTILGGAWYAAVELQEKQKTHL